MSREFVDTLNDCVERLASGESIQTCLDRYPTYADELRPLLEVSASTIRAADDLQPDPSARQRNFQRFAQAAAQASGHRERRKPWWQNYLRLAPIARPALVGFMAIAIMVTGVGATTAASSNSVLGEPLYWVKTTKESVESRLPRSDESRANYEAKLAQVRGDEINKLIQRGEFTRADGTMVRMTIHLKRCAKYAGVTVAADPVEMPFKSNPNMGSDNANRLGERLEHDRKVFMMKAEREQRQFTREQREHMERFLRETDLGYRLFIDAARADSPVRRPFIIVPVPSYETGR
ncbi:MAG: DUF5667 domain-containing protein [Dehalococcoidia bacterium]|nr:DUF5667 domain-containing protein [Dehalococcoidia bacterium]